MNQSDLCESCSFIAGCSSPVARLAHNQTVAGSNPAPATNLSTLALITPSGASDQSGTPNQWAWLGSVWRHFGVITGVPPFE